MRSLERARESAQQRLGELDTERAEIKTSLKSLDAALKAFEKNASKTASQTRPAATTAEVMELAFEILLEKGELPLETLADLIGRQLLEQGKSRMGLKLRLNQALNDERFVQSEQGIRLGSD